MLTCDEIRDQGLAERYLARALSSEEGEAFESHFLQCERCQREIELGATIRRVLRQQPACGVEADSLADLGRRRRVAIAAGVGSLAAAAGLAALLLTQRGAPAPALVALGRVRQPPIYLGLPVRAAEHRADTLFAEAMEAYVAGRYSEASAGLRAALDASVEPAAAEFFSGSSLLMLGRPEDAAETYGRVIALGRTPYLQEAHLYRAKALLRLGRAREALVELRAASGPNQIGQDADSLAARVEGLLRR